MQEMNTGSYSAPVNMLFTLGTPEGYKPNEWLDYRAKGIEPEHIPELIRVATDTSLIKSDTDSLEIWAPTHAWRALGQLRAESAVEPLLSILDPMDADEWVIEEIPEVMGMIGPTALPILTSYIADTSHEDHSRVTATTGVENIGKQWPDARTQCLSILMHQLESFAENSLEINGFLILSLTHLKAKEALPVIEQAFAADRVDTFIAGDWDEVQVKFGLKSQQDVDKIHAKKRAARAALASETDSWLVPYPPIYKPKQEQTSKKKAKNKMTKQSRKKNRKR